jgi:hypothetical protein
VATSGLKKYDEYAHECVRLAEGGDTPERGRRLVELARERRQAALTEGAATGARHSAVAGSRPKSLFG